MAPPAVAPVPVTFVSSHALRGGAERYLELLMDGLGEEWVRGVVVLQEGPFADRLRESGRPVEVVPTGARAGIVTGALRLRRVLRRQSPAVVHANGVKAALVAALATAGTRTPVVWVKHDVSWDSRLGNALAAACAEVVAVSEAITTGLSERARRKVRVVPNGIEPVTVDAAAARAKVTDLAGGEPVVALVGRVHPHKGHLDLVESAPALLERVPAARLLLVGGDDPSQPDYAAAVRARVAELGLGDKFVFAGDRTDAIDLMAGADVVVVPSREESFGLAALEAMAVGTPVVATTAGGLPSVVGDCGTLVAPGEHAALADAMAAVLEDEALRVLMCECGRQRVAEHFRLETTVDAMRARYSAVAGA
jgi:glycosyltransferase involved in cell wall biosynthesis